MLNFFLQSMKIAVAENLYKLFVSFRQMVQFSATLNEKILLLKSFVYFVDITRLIWFPSAGELGKGTNSSHKCFRYLHRITQLQDNCWHCTKKVSVVKTLHIFAKTNIFAFSRMDDCTFEAELKFIPNFDRLL